MNFDTFLSIFSKAVFAKIPEGYIPSIQTLTKNNGSIHHAIAIASESRMEAPLIYIDSYYDLYCKEVPLDTLVELFMKEYNECISFQDSFPDIPHNLEDMKGYVFVKAVHYDRNLPWITTIPHRQVLDLAMIYEFVLPHSSDGYGFGVITYPIMEQLHLTEDELHELAWNNMHTQNPARTISVKQYVDDESDKELAERTMHILTNQTKMHGAAYLFDTKLLQTIANQAESDLCILPSSIHEVVILTYNDTSILPELNQMVREINNSSVDVKEQLSDHAYIFHKENGELSM